MIHVWQSFITTSLQVFFVLPLFLGPSTSYSIYFFIQSSSFRNTCLCHRNLLCCSTNVMSSIPNLSLSSLLYISAGKENTDPRTFFKLAHLANWLWNHFFKLFWPRCYSSIQFRSTRSAWRGSGNKLWHGRQSSHFLLATWVCERHCEYCLHWLISFLSCHPFAINNSNLTKPTRPKFSVGTFRIFVPKAVQ